MKYVTSSAHIPQSHCLSVSNTAINDQAHARLHTGYVPAGCLSAVVDCFTHPVCAIRSRRPVTSLPYQVRRAYFLRVVDLCSICCDARTRAFDNNKGMLKPLKTMTPVFARQYSEHGGSRFQSQAKCHKWELKNRSY